MGTDWPKRKYPAHPPPRGQHNRPIILLATVCTRNRQCLLTNPAVHAALRSAWPRAAGWHVGFYMIMPDHVHLFCSPSELYPRPVAAWVSYWKRLVSREAPSLRGQWQRDCWDTQLRKMDHLREKQEYVRLNPVRRGLARHPQEWPYQGFIHQFRWFG